MPGRWLIGPILLASLVGCGSDDGKSAASTTAPPASVPDDWATYTSSRFLYSIQHPPDWLVIEATQDFPVVGFPFPDGPAIDRFTPTADSTTYMFVSSVGIQIGREASRELDMENLLSCELSDRHEITVDGRDARQEEAYCFEQDYVIEVQLRTETQFYIIDIFSKSVITAEQRAIFESFLASFHVTSA